MLVEIRRTPIGDGNGIQAPHEYAEISRNKKNPDRGRKHVYRNTNRTFKICVEIRRTPIGDGNITILLIVLASPE